MPVKHETYSGWGRVLTADGPRLRPERHSALSRDMANHAGPAIGNLRAYGDAALNSRGPALDMTRLDRLIALDTDAGELEVEAGARLGDMFNVLAPRGWMPAVMPGTGYATVGGAIAADVHGKNHHGAGSFGQHVRGIRLIGPGGAATEIDENSDAELFAATMGGMGLTGIVERARLSLTRCPSGAVRVEERRIPNLAKYLEAFETSTATFQVGWIDASATGEALGRGVLEEAEFADAGRTYKPAGAVKTIPADAPRFALSRPVVRAFNATYFRRAPEGGRVRFRSLHDFFFPLDKLRAWNRLYGKRGFHQFQCVLPPDRAAMILDHLLREISASGLAAPLAVLKKMGDGRAGPLSFPMAGYTLAVDFPDSDAARALIGRLIDQTVEAGGRIYLAKDSLCGPEPIPRMYPELDRFREAVRRADPDGVFETDLARRLDLRGAA